MRVLQSKSKFRQPFRHLWLWIHHLFCHPLSCTHALVLQDVPSLLLLPEFCTGAALQSGSRGSRAQLPALSLPTLNFYLLE